MERASVTDLSARGDAAFLSILREQFRLGELEGHPWPVVGLRQEGVIAYINPAWSRFAHENGDGPVVDERWSLGANYFDAIAEPLRPFYRDLLARAPSAADALQPGAHEYECSSAECYRRFALQIFALRAGEGYVLVNSLLIERPHAAAGHAPESARYVDANGLLRQCAHCRRVELRGDTARWDWVPAWVADPPRFTTHTVCELCYGYYYPGFRGPYPD